MLRYEFFYTQLVLPFVVVGVHLLFQLICHAAANYRTQRPKNLRQRWNNIISGFLGFMSIIYLTVCRYCFGSFYCIQMPPTSGKYVLSMNPTIECWDSAHYIAVGFGIVGLVTYVAGYPILCATILYRLAKYRCHGQQHILERYRVEFS